MNGAEIGDGILDAPQPMRQLVADLAGVYCAADSETDLHAVCALIAQQDTDGSALADTVEYLISTGRHNAASVLPMPGILQ